MRIYQKGWDYFGYYIRIAIGKGGSEIRFNTDGIDLMVGVSLTWKEGFFFSAKLFNFTIAYFAIVYWE